MTPKEKAIELLGKFQKIRVFDEISGGFPLDDKEAMECAKIAVDEISELLTNLELVEDLKYYEEVKTELNKL